MSSEKCIRCDKESTPWAFDSVLGGHLCQSCDDWAKSYERVMSNMRSFSYWEEKIPKETTPENLFYLGLERGMVEAASLFPPGSSQNENIHKRLRKILHGAPPGSILFYKRETTEDGNG